MCSVKQLRKQCRDVCWASFEVQTGRSKIGSEERFSVVDLCTSIDSQVFRYLYMKSVGMQWRSKDS